MTTHRLTLFRDGRLVGHLDSATPHSPADLDDLASLLQASGVFTIERYVASGETRVLEIGPGGARLLGSRQEFVRVGDE